MTTSLVIFIKAMLFEYFNKLFGCKPRKFWGHAAISITSEISSGTGRLSFSRDSIYAWMASFALEMASSYVSPSVIQPGRAGTVTVYPPSSAGVKLIV